MHETPPGRQLFLSQHRYRTRAAGVKNYDLEKHRIKMLVDIKRIANTMVYIKTLKMENGEGESRDVLENLFGAGKDTH